MTRPDPLSDQRRRDWAMACLSEDYAMSERMNQAERYPPPGAQVPAQPAPAPRRKPTRRDWRDFLGMLVILGLVLAGWWMFIEWQALGGMWH